MNIIESVFSPAWYRVAGLHPRLRSHVRVDRHVYRHQVWYVLNDSGCGRHHRVNEMAYQIVARLDGERSVHQVWETVAAQLRDQSPTQDEVIQILCQLNEADLIQCEMTPDVAELFRRGEERTRVRRRASLNPLAFRVTLFDPSALLDRLVPLLRPLIHPLALWFWAGAVLLAVMAAHANWDALRAHTTLHTLTPRYLLLLWVCYPIIKAIHELAHAVAVRYWGGEIHEMGITLLILMPVPYVDASASSAFRAKRQRIFCAAAGIMAELALAALALGVWLHVEDGLTRDIAFVTMLIGSVSTILFNANPLLRFDGYYVFCDALELPNLGPRSNAYLAHLAQRYLLGSRGVRAPGDSAGERAWLCAYGIASNGYRVMLSGAIVLWVGAKSALLGFAVAVMSLYALLLKPVFRGFKFIAAAPSLTGHRMRAGFAATALSAALIAIVVWLPVPCVTVAEGIVWVPEHARVRAGNEGFVVKFLATDGQQVKRGDPLLVLAEPTLVNRQAKVTSQLTTLDVEFHDALLNDPVAARGLAEKIASAQASLREIEDRLAKLIVRSETEGVLNMPRQQNLLSRYVTQGAILAHVLAPQDIAVRVVVPQDDVALVRSRTHAVEVRLAEHPNSVFNASQTGEIPAATHTLPSRMLGDRGDGPFTTDPLDPEGVHTLEPFFLVDLTLRAQPLERVGGRATVRFDHGAEPLFAQLRRGFGQVFLRHFEAGRVN